MMSRTYRSKGGSLWEIRDRRSPEVSQHLFIPSFLVAWPRWLAVIGNDGSPVRLRNGKVALLLNKGLSDEQLIKKLQMPANMTRYKLLPMQGFSEQKTHVSKTHVATVAALLALTVLLTFTMNQHQASLPSLKKQANVAELNSCKKVSLLGEILPRNVKAHTTTSIHSITYRNQQATRFGGLTQIQLRRMCDGKTFRLQAWQSKDSLKVFRVG